MIPNAKRGHENVAHPALRRVYKDVRGLPQAPETIRMIE